MKVEICNAAGGDSHTCRTVSGLSRTVCTHEPFGGFKVIISSGFPIADAVAIVRYANAVKREWRVTRKLSSADWDDIAEGAIAQARRYGEL